MNGCCISNKLIDEATSKHDYSVFSLFRRSFPPSNLLWKEGGILHLLTLPMCEDAKERGDALKGSIVSSVTLASFWPDAKH